MDGKGDKNVNKMGEQATSEGWKDILYNFSQSTTMHGVQFVGDATTNKLRRCIWLILVFGMNVVFIMLLVLRFAYFVQRPVSTKVSIEHTTSLPFPAVTLCNFNKYKKSRTENNTYWDFTQHPDYRNFVTSLMVRRDPKETLAIIDAVDKSQMWAQIFFNSTEPPESYKLFGHLIEDMAIRCRYQDQDFNCSSEFTQVVTSFGLCYTFNSNGTLHALKGGSYSGLSLILRVEHEDYMIGQISSGSTGIKMLIHDPQDFPNVEDMGFALSPGTETYVTVQRKLVIGLPRPYDGNNCIDLDTVSNPLQFYKPYSYNSCLLECEMLHVVKKCGCQVVYHRGTDFKYCTTYQWLTCAIGAIDKHKRDINSDCGCQVPCVYSSYDVGLSSARYSSQALLSLVPNLRNLTLEKLREEQLEVKIYYKELIYDRVEQIPSYTALDLLGTIGGYLGIFLGSSFLTSAEIFDLCGQLLAAAWMKYFHQRTTVHSISIHQ